MSPIPHLHSETNILPLRTHMDMLGAQFFAKLSNPSHPAHHLSYFPPASRSMKATPASHFLSLVRKFSNSIPPSPSQIHTSVVAEAISSAPPNPLIGCPPPDLSPVEA